MVPVLEASQLILSTMPCYAVDFINTSTRFTPSSSEAMESADNSMEKQAKESVLSIRPVSMNDFEEALAMLQGRSSLEGGNGSQFVVSYHMEVVCARLCSVLFTHTRGRIDTIVVGILRMLRGKGIATGCS